MRARRARTGGACRGRHRPRRRDPGWSRRLRPATIGTRRAPRYRGPELARPRRRRLPRRAEGGPAQHGPRRAVRRRARDANRAARRRPGGASRAERGDRAAGQRARREGLRQLGPLMPLEPRIRVSAVLRWEDRVLLCRHEKSGREYWLLPGGGVNSGESLVEALRRELDEEVAIGDDLTFERPVAVVDSIAPRRVFVGKHVVHIIFAADLSGRSLERVVSTDAAVRGHRLFGAAVSARFPRRAVSAPAGVRPVTRLAGGNRTAAVPPPPIQRFLGR